MTSAAGQETWLRPLPDNVLRIGHCVSSFLAERRGVMRKITIEAEMSFYELIH